MSYQINYSDTINNPDPLIVNDGQINSDTSLVFPGRNTSGYSQSIGENFLHLLENFANVDPPKNPVKGQLWFDTTLGTVQLKIYDGAAWHAAGGVDKTPSAPKSAFAGDLWVNTNTQQLFMYNGVNEWLLIGPKYTSGLRTDVEMETILDIKSNIQTVLTVLINGDRIAIISKSQFIPKSVLVGFPVIQPGINLSSVYNNVWGIAESAANLQIGSTKVPASQFVQIDSPFTTTKSISVKSNSSAITAGDASPISLQVEPNGLSGVLSHNLGINLKVIKAGETFPETIMRVDSGKVGINTDNPQRELDVIGGALFSGSIKTTDTTSSLAVTEGALVVAGGVGIGQNINIGGSAKVGGAITVSDIIPNVAEVYDIGSPDNEFRKIHAIDFYGNFHGTLFGYFTGDVIGSALTLSQNKKFSLAGGDVLASEVEFNGSADVALVANVSNTFVSSKNLITDLTDTDEILISRNSTLNKVTKKTLWDNIAQIPVGAILPYFGTRDSLPVGWLLCDGSKILKSVYTILFSVIGDTFYDPADPAGAYFLLPDLRGRTPMGLDNMTNIGSDNVIPPTTAAGRVTDYAATLLGQSAGISPTTTEARNTHPYISTNYIIYTGKI